MDRDEKIKIAQKFAKETVKNCLITANSNTKLADAVRASGAQQANVVSTMMSLQKKPCFQEGGIVNSSSSNDVAMVTGGEFVVGKNVASKNAITVNIKQQLSPSEEQSTRDALSDHCLFNCDH